jgi:hypothetical protein
MTIRHCEKPCDEAISESRAVTNQQMRAQLPNKKSPKFPWGFILNLI